MTPYSAYGYGILRDHATSMQRAMGGVGYAMNSGRQINTMNPASHAAIDSLTFLFDMGIDMTNMWQNETVDGTKTNNSVFGGGLDYATMQVPIGRYMGASVGLLPYSAVGYAFGNVIDNGTDVRQGSGSINELYVALAARPFKGFALGANISYLFGTIINETYATTNAASVALFQNQMIVRDFHLNFGIQYTLSFNQGDRLTAGVTYSPEKSLLGTARQVYYEPSQDTGPIYYDEHKLRNNYTLPETWGAGLNYHWNQRLMVEFDYTYQPWAKQKYRGYLDQPRNFTFCDRTKYALGIQYTPDPRGNYGKRMNYRLGASLADDYMAIQGNQLRQHTVSCGFGFPVPNFKTIVNVGFEWLHRQGTPNPLIKEDYLNITIGVNFNEMWFRQSKIY